MKKQQRIPKITIIKAKNPNYKAVAESIIKRSQIININELKPKRDIAI